MSGRRSASWPEYNGRKVVLEDDSRLHQGTPVNVQPDTVWQIGDDMQAVGFVRVKVDGTLVVRGTLVML